MADNKMIFKCKNCNQMYCGNCSTLKLNWQQFCSIECEIEYNKELAEAEKTQINIVGVTLPYKTL